MHNVYQFTIEGKKEIFVTVLGNPWHEPPIVGDGLVKFDTNSKQFVNRHALKFNGRTAVQ